MNGVANGNTRYVSVQRTAEISMEMLKARSALAEVPGGGFNEGAMSSEAVVIHDSGSLKARVPSLVGHAE